MEELGYTFEDEYFCWARDGYDENNKGYMHY